MIKDVRTLRAFLLDMDGTLYLGDELIDGAAELLGLLRNTGRSALFLTNNSSKNRMAYVEKLNRLGIPAEPDDIFTSGEATAIYLNKVRPGARLYVLGTPALCAELSSAGFCLCEKAPDSVVLGFDTTLTYEKIHKACDFLREGVPFIATHADLNCPVSGGKMMPDAGSMIRMFETATGVSPLVIGKPNPSMAEAVFAKYGFKPEETAMVGDRLYTDIAFGAAAGITCVLVLSGETSQEDYASQSLYHADYIYPSVKNLYAALK